MNSDFCLAVHALVYLNHKQTTVSSEALADNICTNPARVRRVMAKLRAADLAAAREGSEGGFRFEKDAAAVTLAAVADALETRFVAANWHSGSSEKNCRVSSGMAGVMDGIFLILNSRCSEALQQITIADINEQLFGADAENAHN